MMETLIVNDTRPPKIYRIERDGETGAVSVAVGIKGRAGIHWDRLPHCNLHSPSGFEVGYCGSGPADTAASILADYFGEEREFVERAWRGRWQSRPSLALKLHQSFKFEVIAGVQLEPGKSYMLEESRIAAWLVDNHPEYLNPLESVQCPRCDETLWREPDLYATAETWQEATRQFKLAHQGHNPEEAQSAPRE
jgi:hypothetical protein